MPPHDSPEPGHAPDELAELAEFEALLHDLPVRGPSPMLDERIATTLHTTRSDAAPPRPMHTAHTTRPAHTAVLRYPAVAALLLIAGAATVAFLIHNNTEPDNSAPLADNPRRLPAPAPNPASVINTANTFNPDPTPIRLRWSRDIGEQTRYTPTGRPYRAIVREAVDQQTWYDPQTGATMQVCVPREELIVVHQDTF